MKKPRSVSHNVTSHISVLLTALLVFFIPSNLFLKFAEPSAYVSGLLVDYLLPKIYLSDLVIFGLFGVWMWEVLQRGKVQWKFKLSNVMLVFVMLFLLVVIRQFSTEKPLAAFWFLFKILEMCGICAFFLNHRTLLTNTIVNVALIFTLLFQSFLGIYQFHTQQSFFSSYYFFGEVNFGRQLFLAKGIFNGAEKILPYGTTAHPNILAGCIVIGLAILLMQKRKNTIVEKATKILIVLVTLYALFLTQSVEAVISLLILGFALYPKYLATWYQKHWRFPVSLHTLIMSIFAAGIFISPFVVHQLATDYPLNLSFVRRDQLNQAAAEMIIDRPFIGVGLNNFTANLEKYFHTPEVVRFVQPVHNVFLLWLAETGLLGGAMVAVGFWVLWQKKVLHASPHAPLILILLPLMVFDHYLLTQQTGVLIVILFLAHLYSHEQISYNKKVL